MNRLEWKSVVGKTKWASKKKRLGKRELGELMNAQIVLGRIKPELPKENFIENSKQPQSIKDILGIN